MFIYCTVLSSVVDSQCRRHHSLAHLVESLAVIAGLPISESSGVSEGGWHRLEPVKWQRGGGEAIRGAGGRRASRAAVLKGRRCIREVAAVGGGWLQAVGLRLSGRGGGRAGLPEVGLRLAGRRSRGGAAAR